MPNYVIEPRTSEGTFAKRLVGAPNQARAISHVIEDIPTVRLAEPHDYIECTKAGIELENAASAGLS